MINTLETSTSRHACDDLGARLVESATGEWQLMPSQNLVQREALGGLIRSLLNEFGDPQGKAERKRLGPMKSMENMDKHGSGG